MKPSKSLNAAGLALRAAPATACDLEAYGQQRFSPFAAMHGGGAPLTSPADQSTASDQTSSQQGDQSSTPSGQEQASGSGDGAPSKEGRQAEPATWGSGQEDAAIFR